MDKSLYLDQVCINYGEYQAVTDVSLELHEGMIGCLLGPSGCGKTTLLRAIAGFESISSGSITLWNQVISSPEQKTQPEKRNIGMVFQDFALFPHMNIEDNIAFGIRKQRSADKKARVKELLSLIDLEGYEKRFPHELSGGQQQRIALARALAPRPRLLLMDEPLGSQDIELREMLAKEVRRILKQEGTTAILVTHDQHEAFAMSDEVGVLQAGKLMQWATPYDLYHQPDNPFVAHFIGQGVLINGTVTEDCAVDTPIGCLAVAAPNGCQCQDQLDVLIRPDDIEVNQHGNLRAKIVARLFRGSQYLYTLELEDGTQVMTMTPSHHVYEDGSTIRFDLDLQHLVILPKAS